MGKSFLQKCATALHRYLQLHLFLTIVSLPFLVQWGLPISLLSPIGNCIFSPFLSAFLLISSLVFFTELCAIPNGLLLLVLEKITALWHWLLAIQPTTVFVGFYAPSWPIIYVIPIGAIAVMHRRITRNDVQRSLALCMLLFGTLSCLHLGAQRKRIAQLGCNAGTLTALRTCNGIIVVDPGVVAKTAGAESWVTHQAVPELIKATGALSVDTYVCFKPGARIFESLAILCTKMHVNRIIFPKWDGWLAYNAWRAYQLLRTTAQNHGCSIILCTKSMTLCDTSTEHIAISPTGKTMRYGTDVAFPLLHVHGALEHESVDITYTKSNNSMHKKQGVSA